MAKINSDGSLQELPLSVLHLDDGNPRFGGREKSSRTESQILDEIINQHGISDVLSSISTNGFFDSEPLVGAVNKSHGNEVTILEGNRRLSACLVIVRDPRSKGHESLSAKYASNKLKANSTIPVQVYNWNKKTDRDKLLPYLGIRHIVGAAQWDSYAKAAWVALTLKNNQISIDEIRSMIGDDQKFIDRILEGYHFIEQAVNENSYDPKESLRSGRGSFQEFPFSWVYTALGYKNIREYLELPSSSTINERPIPQAKLDRAGKLLGFMFGRSGRNAAIADSRQIGKLAQAIGNQEALADLDQGTSVEKALEKLNPPEQRLSELLIRADRLLEECAGIASGIKSIDRTTINELIERAEGVVSRAEVLSEIFESIKSAKSKRGKRS